MKIMKYWLTSQAVNQAHSLAMFVGLNKLENQFKSMLKKKNMNKLQGIN